MVRLVLWSALAIALVAAAGTVLKVRSLLGRATPPFTEPAPGGVAPLSLTTPDGLRFGAWLAQAEAHRPSVLLLHGNGGSRSSLKSQFMALRDHGYTVMSISLRAHGDSEGELNDVGYGARHEVCASARFLRSKLPAGRPLVVSAFSLGAAAAIFSSLECPDAFDGHLLEAPYRDLPRAAANRLRERLPGPAASLAYVAMEVVARLMLPVPPDEISPRKVAARLRGKPNVLFVAHADDPKCHLDEVQAVYARVGPPAKLIVLSRGGHKSFFRSDPQAYFEALGRLSQTPRKQPQP